MFNRILIALGVRKKVVPDTLTPEEKQVVDKWLSDIKRRGGYGKLGATSPLYPTSRTQVPPKAPPPPSDIVFYDPRIGRSVQEEGSRIIRTMPAELFSSDTDGTHAKGGEFSGAGASGSWDSPSTSSSDTSSSSSDSGSSSCGSD